MHIGRVLVPVGFSPPSTLAVDYALVETIPLAVRARCRGRLLCLLDWRLLADSHGKRQSNYITGSLKLCRVLSG